MSALLAVLWALGAVSGPAAHAREELSFRVPRTLLHALAAPDGWRRPGLREELAAANPGIRSPLLGGDANRFSLAWEVKGVGAFRLAGPRMAAYRLSLGVIGEAESLLTLPQGYGVAETRSEAGTLVVRVAPGEASEAEEAEEAEEAPDLAGALRERGSATLRLLGSHRYQKPSLGGLNPDNRLLALPRQVSEGEVRLDLSADLGRLSLLAKPRARWAREHWQEGPAAGDSDTDAEVVLLEGSAQLRLRQNLFASLGRENLQWGPGQLANPSNPFFADNGRENPVREVPGMDFARVVWLPTAAWTLSWIANTGRGEGDVPGGEWRGSQALKLDYLGYAAHGALLLHAGTGVRPSLRGYGQVTATEALLLYAEAGVSRGTRARYPADGPPPLGVALEETKKDVPRWFPTSLLGAAYTLRLGPTLSAEYLYYREGYDDAEAERFFDLAHGAGALAAAGLAAPDPDGFSTRLRLLRRNYLFVQYLHTEIARRLTLLLRSTQNLDDGSQLVTGFAEWNLSDHWRLFAFGAHGSGGNRDEFGSALRYLGLAGVEWSAF
ncbi:MAG: hypothetical protein AB1578_02070 [Thermodesulfobacteriota bacterium]